MRYLTRPRCQDNRSISRDGRDTAFRHTNDSLDHSSHDDHLNDTRQLAINDVPAENNVEMCTFRRNEIFLPPDILFQVKLLSQMSTHRGNDLIIHSEILELIKDHAKTHSADFSSLQIMSRHTLIRLLTTHYRLDFLKPTLPTALISDGHCSHIQC
jgi:hypothetical protein